MATEIKIPYMAAYGYIPKVLEKIRQAQTPERFTQDFLATKLQFGNNGSARPVIPFLKKVGFLRSDGTPTDLYRRYRNPSERGAVLASAVRTGYSPLYELNEYVHDATASDLKGLVIRVTGLEDDAQQVKNIIGSFNSLRADADFEKDLSDGDGVQDGEVPASNAGSSHTASDGTDFAPPQLNLGYTINLHLPATSDVAVFNAIFRSLRENLFS